MALTNQQTLRGIFDGKDEQATALIIPPANDKPAGAPAAENVIELNFKQVVLCFESPQQIPSSRRLQLHYQVLSVARVLRAAGVGSSAGEVVSMSLPNGLEFVAAFLGVTWPSAAAAPLNPQYTVEEVVFYLQDTKSKLLILPKGENKNARQGKPALFVPC